ncbi:MAG: hypothetical protein V4564_13050 [Pseudomonadota bacterium]|uniref:hypothetical protein n=1 Tax=Sphingomonas sp. ERG5 TaxID=1381597 RepID=UPI00054C3B9D|nr:hypothetical protein [Sphingomonas sp. ERG5]
MDIALHFINRSNDAGNAHVVIFQHVASLDEPAAALKVIRNPAADERHDFTASTDAGDTLWVGTARNVCGDDLVPPELAAGGAIALSLAGVIGAGIVMTGGSGEPLAFALTDIVTG